MAGLLFRELLDQTERMTADAAGGKPTSRIRVWRVISPYADAVRADPQCPTPFVTSHPSNPAMICDRIDLESDGNNNTILSAAYSTDQRFRSVILRRVPVTPESWGWGARDVVIEIPSNYRTTVRYPIAPNAPPGSPSTKEVWSLSKIRLAETRMQRTIRVTFPLAQFAQLDYIATQNRVIHTIRANRYQFLPDLNAVKRIDDATYEARYTWEFDQGTLATSEMVDPTPTGYSAAIALDPAITQPAQAPYILRRPYAVLVGIPYAPQGVPFDPAIHRFIAKNVINTREVPDGWRLLPGCPNLG